MKEVTAQELKELRPKEFEREYYSWASHQEYYRDYMEEGFKERALEEGIDVDYVEMHQYNAQFAGRVWLDQFMEFTGLHEKYLALYEDSKACKTYVRVTTERYHMSYHVGYAGGDTHPTGVFQHLDMEDWCALVNEQVEECDYLTEVEDRCNQLCRELFRAMEQDYEEQTNVRAFLEYCDCNEVTFSIEEEEDEIHS